MTNSSAITSRRKGGAQIASTRSILIVAGCCLGIVAATAAALTSAIAWASPIGFFSSLAAGFFCVDPLRAELQSW